MVKPSKICSWSREKCLYQILLTVGPGSTTAPSNGSVVVSTRFTLMFEVFAEINTTSPVCRWSELYGEHGWYLISIQSVSDQHTRGISCTHSVDKAPVNSYIRK
ncbi:hypothetical protein Y1Q_0005230 [Alligator mississippiensis]|uniref:Uncharacterized protein n=1 Tax=Alligator mississippiensis TaxID=8496 RepID=A0A151MT33_ALLMI|nr:hypothetical protein Y1Q_0005230 [Alligator mississippiensis]